MKNIGEAIEKAAKHLPEGFVINVMVERDGYDVSLIQFESPTISIDGGNGIVSDINEAICQANGFVD